MKPSDFIHPEDAAALRQMEGIPGFAALVKKILAIGIENLQYGVNMASSKRLSEKQLPCDDFLSFINAMRVFDTKGLPLDLKHLCDLFEQYANRGIRFLQKQYRDDYVPVQDVFFWPLKGSLASVIREIL